MGRKGVKLEFRLQTTLLLRLRCPHFLAADLLARVYSGLVYALRPTSSQLLRTAIICICERNSLRSVNNWKQFALHASCIIYETAYRHYQHIISTAPFSRV